MPNILLIARLLRPEEIKTIRVTSRGVSPYFLARKHTRQSRGHADSPVFANGEVLTYFPCARSHRPTFGEQTAGTARYPGLVEGDHLGGRG
jgi:hypothetical protein